MFLLVPPGPAESRGDWRPASLSGQGRAAQPPGFLKGWTQPLSLWTSGEALTGSEWVQAALPAPRRIAQDSVWQRLLEVLRISSLRAWPGVAAASPSCLSG